MRCSYCKILILVFLLGYLHLAVLAQTLQSVSPDGRFFISVKYEKDTSEYSPQVKNYGIQSEALVKSRFYRISVYDLDRKKKIQSIRFKVKDEPVPDTVSLSRGAQNFYLRCGFHYYVFHTHKGIIVADYFYPSQKDIYKLTRQHNFDAGYYKGQKVICFPNFDNIYLVRKSTRIIVADAQTGKQLNYFSGFSRSAAFKSFEFTGDDNYIIAKDTRNRTYLWKNGQSKIFKRLIVDQVAFSNGNKQLFTLKATKTGFALAVYSLPDGELLSTIRKHRFFMTYPPPVHEGRKIIIDYPQKKESYYFRLSPSGKNLLVGFDYNRLSDMYIVFDVLTSASLGSFEDKKSDRKNIKVDWISDNKIEVAESDKLSRIYTVPGTKFSITADYGFPAGMNGFATGENERKLRKQSTLNSYKNYVVFPFSHSKTVKGFILKNATSQNHESVVVPNTKFCAFTPDGKSVILTTGEGHPAKIDIKKLYETHGIQSGYARGFDDNIPVKSEDWVREDGSPPAGYAYYRLDSIVTLDRITPKTKIHLIDKSINFSGSTVAIDVHLLDDQGYYFFGAATPENKDVWCGLFVQRPDSTIEEIKDYTIEENSGDSLTNAIAVVMDHSGSLGMYRAFEIEKGVKSLIDQKNKNDGMALVKYDNLIGIEAYLTKDPKSLDTLLQMNGMFGYGGTTALLDAINTGISILKNQTGYDRKAVLILTDGMENSSTIKKQQLLKRALENNIKIFAVGFGNMVDDDYLETLAKTTGGSYYRIYSTKDLRWIFDDIYNKLNNYYTIRFKSQSTGFRELIIKVCINNAPPLVVQVNNTKIPGFEITDTIPFELKIPVVSLNNDSVILQKPELKKKLEEKPPVDLAKFLPDSINLKNEFENLEFPDIKFYFDKTEIIPGTDHGLENVAAYLKKHIDTRIEISGHTDSIGSIQYNIGLSNRRAEKVKSMLVAMGIDKDRIYIRGKGETSPATRNSDFWGRTYNRRVEFRLILPKKITAKKNRR